MTTQVKGIVAQVLARLAKENIFAELNTFQKGVTLGTDMFLDPITFAARERLLLNKGFFTKYHTVQSDIAYGFATNIYRDAGSALTVGFQCSAFAMNSSVSGITFGGAFEAWNKPGCATHLTSVEASIINETSSTTSAKIALNVVYKNRADGVAAVQSGISSNAYNCNAIGLWLTSQTSSSAGEYCGFRFGIKFDEWAIDRDINGTGIGIDFASVHRNVGFNDPTTAYPMTAAIRLRDYQSILWNGDPTLPGNPTDPASPVRTYFDYVASEWKLTNAGVGIIRANVNTGDVFIKPEGWLVLSGDAATGIRLRSHNDGVSTYLAINGGKLVPALGISIPSGALVTDTVGAAGGAAAPPATPVKWVIHYIDGVAYKVPYYNA